MNEAEKASIEAIKGENLEKQEAADALALALKYTRQGRDIKGIKLLRRNKAPGYDLDTARIQYEDGTVKNVSIFADSALAMMKDICRAVG